MIVCFFGCGRFCFFLLLVVVVMAVVAVDTYLFVLGFVIWDTGQGDSGLEALIQVFTPARKMHSESTKETLGVATGGQLKILEAYE